MEDIFDGIVILICGIIGVAFMGLVVTMFFALGVDFVKSTHAVGFVSQDRRGVFVQEFKEEKDGCIYYVDVYGSEGKTCGAYAITRY